MKKHLVKFIAWVAGFVDRPWYIWLLASVAALDLFVVVFPVDWFVISTALLRKRRGYTLAAACALGSAIGAYALGFVADVYGMSVVHYFVRNTETSHRWMNTVQFIHHYGAWALAFISVGPLPQQPAVAICGLAHMHGYKIFASVLAGRMVKYLFLAWAALNAPGLLKKTGLMKPVQAATGTLPAEPQKES